MSLGRSQHDILDTAGVLSACAGPAHYGEDLQPQLVADAVQDYGPADALFDWLYPEDRQPAYDPLKNPVPPCPGDFPLLPSGYT